MDKPKPRIITNIASLIMRKFAAAKFAVQQAAADKKHAAQADVNNRSSRRYRSKFNWFSRTWRGQASTPGSNVLRGYRSRLTHSMSAYTAEQNLRPSNTPNTRRRDRNAAARAVKRINKENTQIMQQVCSQRARRQHSEH